MTGIVYQSIEPESGPEGLGGFLIVIACGLAYTVIAIPASFVFEWLPWAVSAETWSLILDPVGHGYHPLLAVFIYVNLLADIALAIAAFVGLILFFRRSPLFPKYLISYYLATVAVATGMLIVEEEMWTSEVFSHSETAGTAVKAFIAAVIWVPYLSRSRRVKNTFVKSRPASAASPAGSQTAGV